MMKQCRYLFSSIDLHTDLLSLKDIQTAISKVVISKEQLFIDSIQNNDPKKNIWREIKKSYIHPEDAVRIVKQMALLQVSQSEQVQVLDQQKHQHQLIKEEVFNYFLKYFNKRYEKLTFKQLAVILETYAIANRFDQQFFRTFENEIYERIENSDEVIDYRDVEKILWAYQHCNYGSAVLYKSIADVIKTAHQEIDPIKLCYYAYLYSKSRENINGGYGIYKLAEETVTRRLKTYDLKQLVRISEYMLQPNIGSNKFQEQIEEALCEQLPREMPLSVLVSLVKYTSTYYFKFNDRALFHKLEGACLNLISDLNDRQFSIITWSFLRGRRGNHLLYNAIQSELKKRKTISLRSLTLLYLNSAQTVETHALTRLLHSLLQQRDFKTTKRIHLVYLLMASLKSGLPILHEITAEDLKILSISSKLALLIAFQSSVFNHQNLELLKIVISDLKDCKLEGDDIILLNYAQYQFRRRLQDYNKISSEYQISRSLHKNIFHQALFLYPTNETLHSMLLDLHRQHGDNLRFCFKQDHWVVISWTLLSQHLLNPERIIDENILEQALTGIKEIDINTISNIYLYSQSVWMVVLIQQLNLAVGVKLLKLTKQKQIDYTKTVAILANDNEEFLNDVSQKLRTSLSIESIEEQNFINLFDKANQQLIPITWLFQLEEQVVKIGLIVLKEVDAPEMTQMEIGREENLQKIDNTYRIQKLILQELFDWHIEFIHEKDFKTLDDPINYFRDVISVQEEPKPKRPTKSLKFKDKLLKQGSYQDEEVEGFEI